MRTEHVHLEHRPSTALLHDLRGKLQAVVVAILGVLRLDEHVAEDRVLDPRLHALDQVLVVDVADESIGLATR